MKSLIALLIFLCGCCPKICRPNVTNYPIEEQLSEGVRTPKGALVVWHGHSVSKDMLAKVDADIDFVENCVAKHYRVYRRPKRSCYVIYIAPDSRPACADPDQQVFGRAPDSACKEKGLEPTEDCPCGWRVVIQDGKYIVTTPNLYMLRAGLTELLTGTSAYYIWHPYPEMRWITECAKPPIE